MNRHPSDAPRAAPATPPGSATVAGGDPGPDQVDSIPAVVGRYRLGDELARGGVGMVFRALDAALDRDVAVKVLHAHLRGDARAATRFLAEARITARLQHPGVPPVFEVGQLPDGSPFLAMKLIHGQTLQHLLRGRPTPEHDRSRFVAVFEQVCQAVAYAHAHGVIHRDLKPANVMVGEFGEVQVMDWGLAKEVRDADRGPRADDPDATADLPAAPHSQSLTQVGSILGTPAFMPPEQALGAVGRIDRRSDVFGLGAILCTILTGRPPYTGDSAETVRILAAQGKLDDALARLGRCGAEPGLVALCAKCLSPEPANRPGDAGEVARAVAELRADADERARRAERDRAAAEATAAEQRKRRRVQLVLAGAVLLLAAGGAGFAWWQQKQTADRKADTLQRQIEDERLAGETREREARNRDALVAALERTETALRAGDASTAAVGLTEVEKRLPEGGTADFAPRVERCRADLALLEELDQIDNFRWLVDHDRGERTEPMAVVARWERAFAGFGVVPGTTPPAEVARRVTGSLIRDRLLAILDTWLGFAPSQALAGILAEADPDDYRGTVRTAILAGDQVRVRNLAAGVEALEQPLRFAVALGSLEGVPQDRRRAILGRAVATRPGELTALLILGTSNLTQTRVTAAERARWCQAAVAAHPRNAGAWLTLGVALLDAGDLDGAGVAYRAAIKLDPTSAVAHNDLGVTLYRKKDYDGAVAACREAIKLKPNYATYHKNLGAALRMKQDYDGAIAAFQEAIRLDPTFAAAHDALGVSLHGKGDLNGAIAAHKEAIKLAPKSALAYSNLGHTLFDRGDPDGAIRACRKSVQLDPKSPTAHNVLGAALSATGDLDEALAAFQEAIRLDPSNTETRGNWVATLKKLVHYDPKDARSNYRLGNAFEIQRDLNGAVLFYRKALELDPKDARTHNSLGFTLKDMGDLDGAAAAYREAIRCDPKYALPRANLAFVLQAKGDLNGAITAYRESLALAPNNVIAQNNLGVALREKGDLDGAIAAFREAVRLDPNNPGRQRVLEAALELKAERATRTAPPPREAKQP